MQGKGITRDGWHCLWLGPGVPCRWSPQLISPLLPFLALTHPCLFLKQGVVLPPQNACLIPQRDKGILPICQSPVSHPQLEHVAIICSTREARATSCGQEHSSDMMGTRTLQRPAVPCHG